MRKNNVLKMMLCIVMLCVVSAFAASASAASSSESEQFLQLINRERANAGVSAVTIGSQNLNAAAQAALPDIYAVLGSTPSDTNVQTELLGASTLDSTFTQSGSADTIRSLAYGQAAAVQYSSYAMMLALRVDPLSVASLDDLRDQVLTDMKTSELKTALSDSGASLENHLDTSAMNKLPMTKIVNK